MLAVVASGLIKLLTTQPPEEYVGAIVAGSLGNLIENSDLQELLASISLSAAKTACVQRAFRIAGPYSMLVIDMVC